MLKERRIALCMIICAAIGVMANAYPGEGYSELEGMTGSQDVRSLDRRISSLEQRLYSIETSINRLERSAIAQPRPATSPGARDPEINLLRGEIQTLQLRLSEIECGLLKLDQRTLAPAVREARRSSGERSADPCRIDPAGPLRLSTRP